MNFRSLRNYVKIARLDHWVKQMFIVPGIIFALFILGWSFDPLSTGKFIMNLVFGFLATCFIASANYIINEWLDADFDKFHPVKKNRPVVAANLKPWIIVSMYTVFSLVGLAFAFFVNWYVFGMVAFLWVMGIVYNVRPLRSKEIAYVDVLSESINNAIRLLIGWFIVTTVLFPSPMIVIGYWMGGAFLMATKRFAEYRMINDPEIAGLYRRSFKRYTENSLMVSAFLYALLSIFTTAIFFITYHPPLFFCIPFLCAMFAYYFKLSYKPDSVVQKPEKLVREKWLMLMVFVFGAIFIGMLFVESPTFTDFISQKIFDNIKL